MAFDLLIELFNHTLFFTFFMCLAFAFIGWLTGSFAVGGFSGFLLFVHVTVEQEITLLTNILYISMVIILFYTGFKLYGEAFSSGGNTDA